MIGFKGTTKQNSIFMFSLNTCTSLDITLYCNILPNEQLNIYNE